jgi:hypothetical protein
MNKKFILKAAVACASLTFVACIPKHLKKYDTDSAGKSNPDTLTSSSDSTAPAAKEKNRKKVKEVEQPAAQRASIYALDKQTFRFAIKEPDVWDAALNVLMRNYNVTIVDRNSGIITTEWDSFYLNNEVFRNRVSIRIGKSSVVDVMIHNNVEKLKDASKAAGTVGAVWLPADDPANEVGRLVQNMALLLNQPPPVLPPSGPVAKGQSQSDSDSSTY